MKRNIACAAVFVFVGIALAACGSDRACILALGGKKLGKLKGARPGRQARPRPNAAFGDEWKLGNVVK